MRSFAFRQQSPCGKIFGNKKTLVCVARLAHTRGSRSHGITHQLADATPRADDERHTMSHEAAVETQSIKSRRGFCPSLRGRFGPHPHNVSLQNLQGDPGTTICVCAIKENPRQKIRSARYVAEARHPLRASCGPGRAGEMTDTANVVGSQHTSRRRFEGHM